MEKTVRVTITDEKCDVQGNDNVKHPLEAILVLEMGIQTIKDKLTQKSNIVLPGAR